MFRLFFSLFIIFFLIQNSVLALDIVYPKQKQVNLSAKSIFFIGNVAKGSTLKINSQNVKIWDGNFFVQTVPLEHGVNTIKFEENNNGKIISDVYKINRSKSKSSGTNYSQKSYIPVEQGKYLYTITVNDFSTVRDKPSYSSNRIIELPKGVVLYLSGRQGDYYKIAEHGKQEFWIHKSNINEPIDVESRYFADVSEPVSYSDDIYNYTKIPVSYSVLYTLHQQDNNKLKLTLYGTSDGNKEYIIDNHEKILGYDAIYNDNKLIVRRYKTPVANDSEKPLAGIKIFVDAGHGGSEKGSVGPTRVCEKDVNLSIARKLIVLLKQDGADVSYSRLDDRQVKLYDRVRKAKENNAIISVSIHSNALPDGKDPYINHGSEVHYYNENSKELANIIKNNLVSDLNLKDNGVHKSSFALNRSTNPVSVLVEVAYMINPEEYMKLRDENFQFQAAKSIKKSLEQFIFLLNNEKKI